MRTRIISVLLLAAAVIYACGPRSHAAEAPPRKRTAKGAGIEGALNVKVADRVSFALQVTNNAARRVELVFPSGQTYDLAVMDSLGREVWRWSEGRLFTQSLQARVLESAESLSYSAAWKPESLHGSFVAVAYLKSENHPLEQRVAFSLP
jgi:hypothetical protein